MSADPTFLPRDADAIAGSQEADERRRNRTADVAHLRALMVTHGPFALTAAGRQILKCR